MPSPIDQAAPTEEEAPASAGVRVCLDCKADGTYSVSSEPLEAEAIEPGADPMETGESYPTLEDAVKAVITKAQEHVTDGNPNEAFAAGYNEGKPAPKPSPKPMGMKR